MPVEEIESLYDEVEEYPTEARDHCQPSPEAGVPRTGLLGVSVYQEPRREKCDEYQDKNDCSERFEQPHDLQFLYRV